MNLLKNRPMLWGGALGLIMGWTVVPGHLFARSARAPTLGAFAVPQTLTGTVSGQPFVWSGSVTFTPGTGTRRTISGVGTFTLGGTPPPPAPLTLTGVTPNPAVTGGPLLLTGSGFAAGARVLWGTTLLPVTVSSATVLTATAPFVLATQSQALSVTVNGQTASGPLLTVNPLLGPPPPPPPPGNVVNVRNFGAKGDDLADDTAACQHALQTVPAGGTLYFPSGIYKLSDWLKFNHPVAMTLTGDGPTSVLHSAAGGGLMIGTGGEPGGPVTVTKLKFQGTHGATMRSTALPTGGVQIFGPVGTVIDNCDFQDVMSAVYDAAPTSGTITRNSRINGWARVAFFVEKNGQVTNCTIDQHDPNPPAGDTSHAFYIHGGASNVTITDNEVSGVAKYFLQEYSEAPNTITTGLQVRRNLVQNCQNGIVLAHSQMGAGDIFNTVIDGNTFRNTNGGSAILIKDGNGVIVSNNVISGCVSYGIGLGGWAPFESGFSIANVDVFGNTVSGCQTGLFGLASNGGSFSNCTFHGNTVSGNRQDLSIQSVLGLSYSPTGPRPPALR
jgi:hypothetical protein